MSEMDYEDTIRKMWGDVILDHSKLFSFRMPWTRLYIVLYSPLSIVVRKQKTYFESVNIYCVNHRWTKFYYQRGTDEYHSWLHLGYLYFHISKKLKDTK
jgi:hypothetical protein